MHPHMQLWELDLLQPVPPSTSCPVANALIISAACHSAIGDDTATNLVAFAHTMLFSLALSTLQEVLHQHYVLEFSSLTLACLKCFPPVSLVMHKGHLDQTHCNQHSTKPNMAELLAELLADFHLLAPASGHCTHSCYMAILKPLGQIYTDQTGKFHMSSSTGNNYVTLVYNHDSNAILVEPCKNCQADTLLAAYQILHAHLCWLDCT